MKHDSSDEAIGARIRGVRIESGLSQEKAAEKLGFTQAKISRLESGVGTHDLDNLRVISAAFNIPLIKLMFNVDPEEIMKTEEKVENKDFEFVAYKVDDGEKSVTKIKVVNPNGEIIRSQMKLLREKGYTMVWCVASQIRESECPVSMARVMANSFVRASEEDCWNRSSENLLALLLLYISRYGDADVSQVITELHDNIRTEEGKKMIRDVLDDDMRSLFNSFVTDRNAEEILNNIQAQISGVNFI